MPSWLDAEYKDCKNCGKRFEVFRASIWAYKQNSLFFCIWHCLREYEKKGANVVGKKLTLEQKKKAVQIAIDGGNPLEYLKECGSDAPDKLWFYIKNKLKESRPDLYEKIPDMRKKDKKNKPEPIVISAKKVEEIKPLEKEQETVIKIAEPPKVTNDITIPCVLNLNDKVKVKLTVHGIKTYIDYLDATNAGIVDNPVIKPKDCLPSIDTEGFTTMQLWQLFSIFGRHIYMAADPVFMPLEIIKVG